MPILTRWHIKTSLIFLIAALLLALSMAARGVLPMPEILVVAGPVYFHLFLVGWVTQLIIGVVYWMFPKYSSERPRGSEKLAWATYGLLNIGLLLRVIAEPVAALQTAVVWDWLLLASALLQWLAGLAFVANTWRRVKER